MTEEALVADDASHYEISLTAGQAFTAFVLLLLSLAAAFAFGLMIGKGQADERLVVKHDPAVINEGAVVVPVRDSGTKVVELTPKHAGEVAAPPGAAVVTPLTADATIQEGTPAVTAPAANDFASPGAAPAAAVEPKPAIVLPKSEPKAAEVKSAEVKSAEVKPAEPRPVVRPAAAAVDSRGPMYAQLMSSSDQKAAEALAAKLIDHGFNGAYVERGTANDKGPLFRVRVRFASETEARAAVDRLKEFSKEVWITRQ